jgi:hypothetical protein
MESFTIAVMLAQMRARGAEIPMEWYSGRWGDTRNSVLATGELVAR